MYSVDFKNVRIQARIADVGGCCGARCVQDFSVAGPDAELTDDEVMWMYCELYKKIRNAYRHVLIAIDAIGSGWSVGTGNSRRTERFSLADFCEKMGFKKAAAGNNPNNGNKLHVYVDNYVNKQRETVKEPPKQPEVEHPAQPDGASDIEAMVRAVFAEIEV